MEVTEEILERVAAHRALGGAPRDEHRWLVEHGELRQIALGEVVTKKGEQAMHLYLLLKGHIVIRMDRGTGIHKVFEWRTGDCGGIMPYSRGAAPPNDAVAEEESEMLMIGREHLPEMARVCPNVTTVLVHAMIDRARQFTSNEVRDEKLISLGKLAAGLAHELNNPASAVVRGAKLLTESIDSSETAARRIGQAGLTDEQFQIIDEIRRMCLKQAPTVARSVLGRSDREDEFVEWLADHGADERCASALAETGVTIDSVEELANAVSSDVLNATIKWMAAGCTVRTLAADIEMAATRMLEIVGAVKGFTYMDHARLPEAVDIRQGISDTLTVLAAKVRSKSVEVSLTMADDLPRAMAVGAELNQVWMNLIDNALDAAPRGGRVQVSATTELGRIAVRVIDNGPGVPPQIAGRIFDPFFTTKGVGKGTGLGLDIVRRLLMQHGGEISLESVPGRTEFQVRLPVATSGA